MYAQNLCAILQLKDVKDPKLHFIRTTLVEISVGLVSEIAPNLCQSSGGLLGFITVVLKNQRTGSDT
jgi:hypothetical protein